MQAVVLKLNTTTQVKVAYVKHAGPLCLLCEACMLQQQHTASALDGMRLVLFLHIRTCSGLHVPDECSVLACQQGPRCAHVAQLVYMCC
jgi:hypothetical protein